MGATLPHTARNAARTDSHSSQLLHDIVFSTLFFTLYTTVIPAEKIKSVYEKQTNKQTSVCVCVSLCVLCRTCRDLVLSLEARKQKGNKRVCGFVIFFMTQYTMI